MKKKPSATWDWGTNEYDHEFEVIVLEVKAVVESKCADDGIAEAVIDGLVDVAAEGNCALKSLTVKLVKREAA